MISTPESVGGLFNTLPIDFGTDERVSVTAPGLSEMDKNETKHPG